MWRSPEEVYLGGGLLQCTAVVGELWQTRSSATIGVLWTAAQDLRLTCWRRDERADISIVCLFFEEGISTITGRLLICASACIWISIREVVNIQIIFFLFSYSSYKMYFV